MPEGGSKLCYEPLQKLGGGEGGFSNGIMEADKIFYKANFTRNLPIGNYIFFVLFNLKNPGIQVKIILATG